MPSSLQVALPTFCIPQSYPCFTAKVQVLLPLRCSDLVPAFSSEQQFCSELALLVISYDSGLDLQLRGLYESGAMLNPLSGSAAGSPGTAQQMLSLSGCWEQRECTESGSYGAVKPGLPALLITDIACLCHPPGHVWTSLSLEAPKSCPTVLLLRSLITLFDI